MMKMNMINMKKAMKIELFVCFMTYLVSYVIPYIIVLFLYLVGLFICYSFNHLIYRRITIYYDMLIFFIISVLLKLHIWLIRVNNRNNLRRRKNNFSIYKSHSFTYAKYDSSSQFFSSFSIDFITTEVYWNLSDNCIPSTSTSSVSPSWRQYAGGTVEYGHFIG